MAQNKGNESEIVKDFRELDRTEKAMLQRIGGTLTKSQRDTLEDLGRLITSLAGPEDVLDSESYSRPIPPRHHRTTPSPQGSQSDETFTATFEESDQRLDQ
jgi:hypothetical protein